MAGLNRTKTIGHKGRKAVRFNSCCRDQQPIARFEPLESRLLLSADVVISEIMAINDSILTDFEGDYSDWIELRNNTSQPIDLSGWYLTDANEQPDGLGLPVLKWQFPDGTTIDANGHLIIFASDKDEIDTGDELHASFKLSSAGEYLALVEADGLTIADAMTPAFPLQHADYSYGLISSGEYRFFTEPTPGSINLEGVINFVQDLSISHDRGFYDSAIDVTITCPTPGAVIHYTTDGTQPTIDSPVYSGPIHIDSTTVLRAAGFVDDWQPSYIDTRSYFYLDDIIQQGDDQSARGFPDQWITSVDAISSNVGYIRDADYAIDQRIVADNPTFKQDLLSIPTLSLVMDPDDLFDTNIGIYTNPNVYHLPNADWTRSTSVELIDPDGGPEFQINSGVRMHGELSRHVDVNIKHNFRLVFQSDYGPTKLDFPMFPGTDVETFDTLIIRAHMGNSWITNSSTAQYIHDQFAHDTMTAMGQPAVDGRFVHLYLNGVYWGLYDIIERPDDSFNAEHLGGEKELYDVFKGNIGAADENGLLQDGIRDNWDELFSYFTDDVTAISDADYAYLEYFLDMDNFIDYMITTFYVGNYDWPRKNWYAAGMRGDEGDPPSTPFKFYVWDNESVMTSVSTNLTQRGDNPQYDTGPLRLFQRLRYNEQFQARFADRVQKHFYNNGALTPENAAARYSQRATEIDRAIVGESARWGDWARPNDPYTRDDWVAQRDWLLNTYFPARSNSVVTSFIGINLYPLLPAPTFNRYGGEVTSGFKLRIYSTSGSIFYSLDGTDPKDGTPATISGYAIDINESTTVKSRVLKNGKWGPLVEADFVVTDASTPDVVVSEIHYNPIDDDLEFIELYNPGDQPVNLFGVHFAEGIQFVFPAMVLEPDEFVVVASNLYQFKANYGENVPVAGQFEFATRLSNAGETIELRDVNDHVIQSFTYDDNWYPATDGMGSSLSSSYILGDHSRWNTSEGWKASTVPGGTPGYDERIDGDANLDGIVDLLDLVTLGEYYNLSDKKVTWREGDFTGNGYVTLVDLVTLGENWGNKTPMSLPGSDTTESNTAMLLWQADQVDNEVIENNSLFASLGSNLEVDESEKPVVLF